MIRIARAQALVFLQICHANRWIWERQGLDSARYHITSISVIN